MEQPKKTLEQVFQNAVNVICLAPVARAETDIVLADLQEALKQIQEMAKELGALKAPKAEAPIDVEEGQEALLAQVT